MKKYKLKFKAKEYYLLNIYPQKILVITEGNLWRSYSSLLLGVTCTIQKLMREINYGNF